MFEKAKNFFNKRRIKKITDELNKDAARHFNECQKMWDAREWEACMRIYCSYDTVSYEGAVHQAHELVKRFKEGVEDEVNESK